MSQVNVERIIGLLATDEGLRRRFVSSPGAALEEIARRGMELNDCERWALAQLDPRELQRFAESMDSRLQKTELGGDGS